LIDWVLSFTELLNGKEGSNDDSEIIFEKNIQKREIKIINNIKC